MRELFLLLCRDEIDEKYRFGGWFLEWRNEHALNLEKHTGEATAMDTVGEFMFKEQKA